MEKLAKKFLKILIDCLSPRDCLVGFDETGGSAKILNMQAIASFALFGPGGGEIILILALLLILFGARKLPEIARRLGRGFLEFDKESRRIGNAIDGEASEAGRSVAGIYGKPAAQALTVINQIAELYDPDVFQRENSPRSRFKSVIEAPAKPWLYMRRLLRALFHIG